MKFRDFVVIHNLNEKQRAFVDPKLLEVYDKLIADRINEAYKEIKILADEMRMLKFGRAVYVSVVKSLDDLHQVTSRKHMSIDIDIEPQIRSFMLKNRNVRIEYEHKIIQDSGLTDFPDLDIILSESMWDRRIYED